MVGSGSSGRGLVRKTGTGNTTPWCSVLYHGTFSVNHHDSRNYSYPHGRPQGTRPLPFEEECLTSCPPPSTPQSVYDPSRSGPSNREVSLRGLDPKVEVEVIKSNLRDLLVSTVR